MNQELMPLRKLLFPSITAILSKQGFNREESLVLANSIIDVVEMRAGQTFKPLMAEHEITELARQAIDGILSVMLPTEEQQVLDELRKIDWGKLTVTKKDGKIVMITPAPDIKVAKD